MAAVVETNGLSKVYGRQKAVDGLSLQVNEGEIFGFLGPNGAGKTTAILMLLGLTEPTAGTARVLGHDPVRDTLAIKRRVGYLPENVGFYEDMTGRENLRYIARLNGIEGAPAAARIADALQTVGLAAEGDKLAGAYSRGMRQRLGLAEILLKDPRLVFLDEPTLGLDPDGINRILELIARLSRERGLTVFFSSHILPQVERICSRVGIMIRGRLVAVGSVEELARSTGTAAGEAATLETIYMRYFQET